MSIKIFYSNTAFRYKGWRNTRKTLEKIIFREKMIPGDISIIITSDDSLIEINREFLEHDYYTDVITFNYNEGKSMNGEIYISSDTVRENAKIYGTGINPEMKRVMIHGILHLAGYNDSNESEKLEMRKLENKWLEEEIV